MRLRNKNLSTEETLDLAGSTGMFTLIQTLSENKKREYFFILLWGHCITLISKPEKFSIVRGIKNYSCMSSWI